MDWNDELMIHTLINWMNGYSDKKEENAILVAVCRFPCLFLAFPLSPSFYFPPPLYFPSTFAPLLSSPLPSSPLENEIFLPFLFPFSVF